MTLTIEERENLLSRLRDYRRQRDQADEQADKDSLARAADLVALYEDRSWVADVPAPVRTHFRGRPVQADSFSRFAKWAKEQTNLAPSTQYQLQHAHELASNYLRQAEINPQGERALRPLYGLTKMGYADRIREVWERAVTLAGGDTPDSTTVRRALSVWKQENLPKVSRPQRERESQRRDALRRARRELLWLVENGYMQDAAAIIDEAEAVAASILGMTPEKGAAA